MWSVELPTEMTGLNLARGRAGEISPTLLYTHLEQINFERPYSLKKHQNLVQDLQKVHRREMTLYTKSGSGSGGTTVPKLKWLENREAF